MRTSPDVNVYLGSAAIYAAHYDNLARRYLRVNKFRNRSRIERSSLLFCAFRNSSCMYFGGIACPRIKKITRVGRNVAIEGHGECSVDAFGEISETGEILTCKNGGRGRRVLVILSRHRPARFVFHCECICNRIVALLKGEEQWSRWLRVGCK